MRFALSSGLVPITAGHIRPPADEVLAGRLAAYEECLHRLPSWVHASWLQQIGLASPAAAHPLLPAALGVAAVPAHVFDQSVNGLALLPPACLCRVLRARALLRRRPALRRCVEPRLRRNMHEWLHPAVFDAVLLESPDAGLERDIDGLPWAPGAQSQDPADALAWEGFCLFQQDNTWTDPQVVQLIRLGFATEAAAPPLLNERPGAADGSVWVLERLARFVPEAPWLCG